MIYLVKIAQFRVMCAIFVCNGAFWNLLFHDGINLCLLVNFGTNVKRIIDNSKLIGVFIFIGG